MSGAATCWPISQMAAQGWRFCPVRSGTRRRVVCLRPRCGRRGAVRLLTGRHAGRSSPAAVVSTPVRKALQVHAVAERERPPLPLPSLPRHRPPSRKCPTPRLRWKTPWAASWTAVEGRAVCPWVTWFIDVATKVIVGVAVTPHEPARDAVLAALRTGISRAEPYGPFGGLPTVVRVDWGKEFLCRTVSRALGGFAVPVDDLPAYKPYRGPGRPPGGEREGRLRAGPPGRQPDAPAQAHGTTLTDRAVHAMARLGDPGLQRQRHRRAGERARAAAAAIWAQVRPVLDIVLAAVDVVAVVYVMRGAFKRDHLLAEARRYLSYVLRGQPHSPSWTNRSCRASSATTPAWPADG